MKTLLVVLVTVALTITVLGQWDRVVGAVRSVGTRPNEPRISLTPTPVSSLASDKVWATVPAPTSIPTIAIPTPLSPGVLTREPTSLYTPTPTTEGTISVPVPPWYQSVKDRISNLNKEPGEIQGQINQVRYRLDYLQRQIELTNFSALPYTSGEDMRGRYETFDVEYLNLRRENIQFAAKVRILTKIDYPTEKDVTVLEELEDVGEVLAGGVQSLGQKVEAAIFELPQVK